MSETTNDPTNEPNVPHEPTTDAPITDVPDTDVPDTDVPDTEQMLAIPRETNGSVAGSPNSARDFEIFASTLDLGDDRWPERPPARGVRLRWPTAILVALLLGGAGLWIGATLQRGEGSGGSNLAGIASAFARLRGGAGGASGAAGFAGRFGGAGAFGGGAGGAGATIGTVTEVAGKTLYITNASGALVKVAIGAATAFTRNASINENDLRPGDTVVVAGSTQKNGTVDATRVAASAQGLTPAGGGGGGGLGAGAGG